MVDYHAPVNEMMFMLKHIAGLEQLNRHSTWADFSEPLCRSILEEAAKFAHGVLAPLNRVGDQQGAQFQSGQVTTAPGWRTAYQQFCDDGWLGLGMSPSFGGQGLPKFIATPVHEMWQSANLAFVLFQALAQGGSEIFLSLATPAQQQTYLEKIIRGDWSVAMALTEAQAGSDLSALSTKATPAANGQYKIKGQKIFITYGEHDLTANIVHLVLARIEGAPQGSQGISLFIVPKFRLDKNGAAAQPNDVSCISVEHKLGLHGSPTCSMVYGENDDCYGELLGEANRGLEAMFILMNEARLSTGLQGVALGEAALQQAEAHAIERRQGRSLTGETHVAIVEHPDVKRMLLLMRSQTTALRALSIYIAACVEQANASDQETQTDLLRARVALLTPVFKAHGTEVGNQIAGTAIQVMGGMGFVEETGVAQFLRDARITTIYEGTTGIQANDLLFRKIIKDQGIALNALLDDITQTAENLAQTDLSQTVSEPIVTATEQLRTVMRDIVAESQYDAFRLHCSAVHVTEAMGILCSAWQLAKLCEAALTDTDEDQHFINNLIAQAEFFCAHVLNKIAGLMRTIRFADRGVKRYSLQ